MPSSLPVLFTHFGDEWIRGSEVVLLDLLGSLDKEKVRPVVWCNGREMAEACRKAGYLTFQDEFHHMFDYGSPKPSASHYFGLIRKCRALCRDHDIRVLHANSLAPAQWLVPAGTAERIPVLAHLHIDYLRRSRYALILHGAELIVGVSRQVIDGPLEDGVASGKARVIYNGIDFARLGDSNVDLRKKLGIPEEAFVIATTGSLIRRKGHDILIRAFRELRPGLILPHLIIPSGGPELDALRDLAATLGIGDRVHFLGYVDDIVPVYKATDAFALASRGDAFGLALAEAGHFGLPAVSTRVGGIPEVVLHGETGLLTPPEDVPAFSHALAQLMNDLDLRRLLGAAAVERVKNNFTADQMAKQFESAYTELAAIPKQDLGWISLVRRLARPYLKLIWFWGRPRRKRYDLDRLEEIRSDVQREKIGDRK
jgi:glycosyltransferase involved in cell wall biosynthesis